MNFTKAAEELHISQPAMSSAMRDLERECGVLLFKKNKNSIQITDEGLILLEEITTILRQYEHLMYVVHDLSLNRKFVRVGLSTLSGNLVYPILCQEFQRQYPDIEIQSVEESTNRQFELLENHQLDVVITVIHNKSEEERKVFDTKYGHWPLKNSRPLFCVSIDNPLASQEKVTWEQMSRESLVLLKDNFNQTMHLKQNFAVRNLNPKIVHYTNQMYTIERFVEKNIAAGFLPDLVVSSNPLMKGLQYDEGEVRAEDARKME